jgi:glycosyltransferase involved in cell wall biosynthesis
VSDYSIIIPHRNEGECLGKTVREVMRTSSPKRIIAIEDEPQQGLSLRRHQGIEMVAEAEVVLIIDAHMAFPEGWAEAMCDVVREHPRAFLCVECRGLHEPTWQPANVHGYGATWHENLPDREGNPRPIMPHWIRRRNPAGSVVEVPIPLGACYAFRRDWYFDGMGAVWKHHRGWGRSEPMLALMNWICGGENLCAQDLWAAHLFRTVARAPTNQTVNIQNVFLIAYGMFGEEDRSRLFDAMDIPLGRPDDYGRKRLDKRGAVDAVRAWIASHGVRTYREYLDRFAVPLPTPKDREPVPQTPPGKPRPTGNEFEVKRRAA